jgi:hypothetical protein
MTSWTKFLNLWNPGVYGEKNPAFIKKFSYVIIETPNYV